MAGGMYRYASPMACRYEACKPVLMGGDPDPDPDPIADPDPCCVIHCLIQIHCLIHCLILI